MALRDHCGSAPVGREGLEGNRTEQSYFLETGCLNHRHSFSARAASPAKDSARADRDCTSALFERSSASAALSRASAGFPNRASRKCGVGFVFSCHLWLFGPFGRNYRLTGKIPGPSQPPRIGSGIGLQT